MTRPTLLWREVEDVLGVPGWTFHVGFTTRQEAGDGPDVTIHAAEINTGHQTLKLSALDLPNVTQLEAIVAEQVEGDNRQAAFELSHGRRYSDHLAPMVHALSAL